MQVKIKKLTPNAIVPRYAKPGDMGMDVTATSVEYKQDIDCFVYHTGLAFEVPEGYGMLIFPRSSNRKTEAYLPNSAGVLDSGYRGELLVCFKNRTTTEISMERDDLDDEYIENPLKDDIVSMYAPYLVGDRIAQIMILPYPTVEFVEVDELSTTERGTGGFGSTGTK